MSRSGGLPGALVISLDFELRWGVRDRCAPGDPYEKNLLGAREVIPAMLDIFASYGIAATWATVGLLFACSRSEANSFAPRDRPEYVDRSLSPFEDTTGENESDDPLHYAPSLIRRIAATPGQEIGTHTFSHYYCLAPGQTARSFRADLESALAIARQFGIRPRSIVFPRNQHNPAYDEILRDLGIMTYRGNPDSWMWRSKDPASARSPLKRAARLADSYVKLGDVSVSWERLAQPSGLTNVPASIFVRPFRPGQRWLEEMRYNRIAAAMRAAAERRRLLHLWWHPHNFGADQEENLAFLTRVLDEYRRLSARYGMVSLSMLGVHELVRGEKVQGSFTDVRT